MDRAEVLEKEVEILGMREELEREKESVQNYKEIAEANEGLVKELRDKLGRVMSEREEDREAADGRVKGLEETIETLESQMKIGEDQKGEREKEREEAREKVRDLERKIGEFEKEVEGLREGERGLKEEVKQQHEKFLVTQNKYEQESISRLSDVKALAEANSENTQLKEKLVSCEVELEGRKQEGEKNAESWKNQEELLKKRGEELGRFLFYILLPPPLFFFPFPFSPLSFFLDNWKN